MQKASEQSWCWGAEKRLSGSWWGWGWGSRGGTDPGGTSCCSGHLQCGTWKRSELLIPPYWYTWTELVTAIYHWKHFLCKRRDRYIYYFISSAFGFSSCSALQSCTALSEVSTWEVQQIKETCPHYEWDSWRRRQRSRQRKKLLFSTQDGSFSIHC